MLWTTKCLPVPQSSPRVPSYTPPVVSFVYSCLTSIGSSELWSSIALDSFLVGLLYLLALPLSHWHVLQLWGWKMSPYLPLPVLDPILIFSQHMLESQYWSAWAIWYLRGGLIDRRMDDHATCTFSNIFTRGSVSNAPQRQHCIAGTPFLPCYPHIISCIFIFSIFIFCLCSMFLWKHEKRLGTPLQGLHPTSSVS